MSYKDIINENKNGCANPHIGAIIKRKRKELKMTLEEVTKGICCVSYLSKLENGTITPKRYVLNEVLNRLKLKEENLRSKTEYNKVITKCIVELYYGRTDYITNAYNEILDVECIHFTDVIKGIYFLSKNEIDEAEKSINNAMILKRQLEQEELYACIIVSSLINISRQKYREALDNIKPVEYVYLGNIELEKYKMYIISKIYFALGRYLQLTNVLISYQELCYKTVDFIGIVNAKRKLCLSLALNGAIEDSMKQYESISKSLKKSEANDFLKELYIALKKPNNVLKMSNATIYDKLWAYNLLNDKTNCIDILDKINILQIKDEKIRMFVESMMKKHYENDYFYVAYLRSTYYPYLLAHGLYEDAKEIHNILFDFLIIESRYKEAVKIDKDFKKIF